MLAFLTLLMVLALGYAYFVEGIFTGFLMCCNVFISGLVAFDFWEPIADQLEPSFRGTFLQGYEDALALVLLFTVTLGALRVLTNNLSNSRIEFDERAQGIGGAILGIMTGYLTAGFLSCVLQTMPFRTTFLGFDGRYDPQQSGLHRILPPDRAWLALMHYAARTPSLPGITSLRSTSLEPSSFDTRVIDGIPRMGPRELMEGN